MADEEEEELPPCPEVYSLTTNGQEKTSSIGFSGKGKAAYTNGDTYEGLFENGARQGRGEYAYRHGDVYVGGFDKNLKSGKGTVNYKKGGFYNGYFKSGLREGEGTFQYANGDIYSGYWVAGKKHGRGTYVFAKTKYAYEGEWKDGQILSGTWSLTDGTKFIGTFSAQKPVGEGVWHTVKGTIVEGSYVQQVLPIDKAEIAPPDKKPETETKICWKTSKLSVRESDDEEEDE